MRRSCRCGSPALAILALLTLASASQAQPVNIALSQVGNPGNAADTTGYGSVGYTYDIGTYDVTVSQYATFLNDVAQTDTYGLYNSDMASVGFFPGGDTGAGILQSGSEGSFSYSITGGAGNDPITYVSWLDAARFCNWIENGRPATGVEDAATTEEGTYILDGDTDITGTTGFETAPTGSAWRLPSEDEWYKAAYYDPSLNGSSGGYWSYATQSNVAPRNVIGSRSNQANYNNGVYSVTQTSSLSSSQNYLTATGTFSGSASYYGTYDQTGDVFQWNDLIVSGSNRELRGGAWDTGSSYGLSSAFSTSASPSNDGDPGIGFRIVEEVPEPGTLALIIAAFIIAIAVRHKFSSRGPAL